MLSTYVSFCWVITAVIICILLFVVLSALLSCGFNPWIILIIFLINFFVLIYIVNSYGNYLMRLADPDDQYSPLIIDHSKATEFKEIKEVTPIQNKSEKSSVVNDLLSDPVNQTCSDSVKAESVIVTN